MGSRLSAWAGRNVAPLILVPLGALLVWVAIWEVWLPRPVSGPTIGRTVTTVDASAGTRPTHKVTTVVRTAAGASPSSRSETLVIVLLLLGSGAAIVGVFHDRIASIELDKDGLKIALTKSEQAAAAELVGRLARSGAGERTVARALGRYVRAVAARRQPAADGRLAGAVARGPAPGLNTAQAKALADRIADDLA